MPQIEISLADWNKRWDEGNIGFHITEPYPALVKYLEKLTEGRDWIEPKIFLPLCGKSVDLKWLAEKKLDVTGVEYVEKGVRDFFKEQNLSFSEKNTSKNTLKLFQTDDGRIKVYQGDFYELDSSILPQKFDLVFDRGSFVAIDIDQREKYVGIMSSLIHEESRWLLITYDYDPSKWDGPPHYTSKDDMEKYFDPGKFNVELLEELRHMEEWGVDWLVERSYIVSLKNTDKTNK